MKNFVQQYSKLMRLISHMVLWIAGIGVVAITAMSAWQVFGRYVLNNSPTWTENLSILFMGWFILLGASVGIREGNHLSFEILLHVLGPKGNYLLNMISDIIVTSFGFGMVFFGIQLLQNAWSTTIPNLGVSGGFSFIALVAGGILVILFSVERILRRLVGLSTARFGEISEE